MLLHVRALMVLLCLPAVACVGSDGDASNSNGITGTTKVQAVVAGNLVALQFPFFSANITGQFSDFDIKAFDSEVLMSGTAGTASTMGEVDTPNPTSACEKSGCAYAMALNANGTKLPFGVLTYFDDTSNSGYSNVAYTAALSNATLAAEEPNTAIKNTITFALPTGSLDTAATAVGSSADAVTKQGLLIGMVVGSMSKASSQYKQLPPPAADATVTLKSNSQVTLYSPSTYSGSAPTGTTEATTNSDGVFFAVGPSASGGSAQTLQFTVALSGSTWQTQTAALIPGYVTIAVFYAN